MLLAAMLSLTVLMFAVSPAMALDRDDRNSNQTVGIQGTANTGNAQNTISVFDGDGVLDGDDVFDYGGFFFRDYGGDEFVDFEFEDVGASIEVSPEQVVSSDKEANQ